LLSQPGWLRSDVVAAGCATADRYTSRDGADVVVALRQAGEEIWAVGIDDTYSRMKHQDDEPLGNAFDITWLTVVCIKLQEIKEGKRPRLRLKG
jgi:hypothetical protein